MFGIIYKITNKINGKIYIGQTINEFEKRWSVHVSSKKGCPYLQNAIQKYGKENFDKVIVARCDSLEEMNHRETYYIKLFNTLAPNGYNLNTGGDSRIPSEETRKKMSEAQKRIGKGRNLGKRASEETKKKMSIINSGEGNPFFGKKHTSEAKLKNSLAHLGKTASEEAKQKMSIAHNGNKYNLGTKASRETLEGMSLRGLERYKSEEYKEKWMRGRDHLKVGIFCLELNINFESIKEASERLGINKTRINRVLSGAVKKTSNGLSFIRIRDI